MTFTAGGLDIPVKININRRLKYVRLGVSGDGVEVSLPERLDDGRISEMLNNRRAWILENYVKYKSMQRERVRRRWATGEKLPFRGEHYGVQVQARERIGAEVEFDSHVFHIYASPLLNGADRTAAIREAAKKWYAKAAERVIGQRLAYYSGIMNVRYNTVRIKAQKTRWGSCSEKGNLNFNWRIILAPPEILDYVVVHELSHLVYMDHSKNFWNTVSRYIADYEYPRRWLRENGERLMF